MHLCYHTSTGWFYSQVYKDRNFRATHDMFSSFMRTFSLYCYALFCFVFNVISPPVNCEFQEDTVYVLFKFEVLEPKPRTQ